VIASAVLPTAIGNAYFMPKHLLPESTPAAVTARTDAKAAEG
jgi:hypothetical protein